MIRQRVFFLVQHGSANRHNQRNCTVNFVFRLLFDGFHHIIVTRHVFADHVADTPGHDGIAVMMKTSRFNGCFQLFHRIGHIGEVLEDSDGIQVFISKVM